LFWGEKGFGRQAIAGAMLMGTAGVPAAFMQLLQLPHPAEKILI
jgi:hypothetical protein